MNTPFAAREIRWGRDLLVGLLVVLSAFLYFSRYCDDSLFQSDSADYIRAIDRGFPASYLDSDSIGLWGVIGLVRRQPDVRSHLWSYLQHQRDAAAFRHFHVAPGLYPNVWAAGLHPGNHTHRLVAAGITAVAVGIAFLGLRLAGVHLLLALLGAALAVVSPSLVATATELSPHPAFLVMTVFSGFSLARFLQTGSRAWMLAAAAGSAGCFATLELSLVSLTAFALALLFNRRRLAAEMTRRDAGQALLIFLATLLVLWPGGVFRGSYALSYGTFIYQALFSRGAYFGSASLPEILMRGCQQSPLVVLVLALAGCAAAVLAIRRKADAYIQVFGILTLGFLAQGVLNRFHNATYAAHFIVLAWLLLMMVMQRSIDQVPETARRAVLAAAGIVVVVVGIAASEWPPVSRQGLERRREIAEHASRVLTVAESRIPDGAVILSNNYAEIWGCYLPRTAVEISESASSLRPRAWLSLPADYWVIADTLLLAKPWNDWIQQHSPSMVGEFAIVHVTQGAVL